MIYIVRKLTMINGKQHWIAILSTKRRWRARLRHFIERHIKGHAVLFEQWPPGVKPPGPTL